MSIAYSEFISSERLIALFSSLVSIDSKSFGEHEMCDFLRHELIRLGFSTTVDDADFKLSGSSGNLYGFLPGTIPGEPLLFCTHMDTVEPSSGKQAILMENGIIRSNGNTVLGADDCAGIAAILEALRTLEENHLPHRSIEVLFTVAEEQYCRGIAQFDYSRLRSKDAYILDLSGPIGTAAEKAPTILSFTVTVTGKAAHAGFAPQDGIHAILAAANAISVLPMGKIDKDTTLNIGIIQGGTATNIVPDRCTVIGEIRSYSHETALDASRLIQTQFLHSAQALGAAIEFQQEVRCQAYAVNPESPTVQRFEQACRSCGLTPALEPTFGGSDNNFLQQNGVNGLVIACAMHQCHSCEEYTTVQELCQIAEITLSLMQSEQ